MTKILLVDDENLILYSLSTTLRHDGSEVTAVANGKDAMSEIGRLPYNICFLDVNLPDANGYDLLKTMQQISPATRIIMMSAIDLVMSNCVISTIMHVISCQNRSTSKMYARL